MPEQELSILIRLRDEASAQLKQMNATVEASAKAWQDNWGAIQRQATQAAGALAAFGAVVTGAFAFAYKASEENRLETARLTVTLRNQGIQYAEVEDSLTNYIGATQKSTGISRSEQVGAFNELLLITGDYSRSMQLLPIVLDLAKAKQMDVTQAAILLGRVAEGNINALNRYGFSMEGVKSAAQALDIIQDKVKGSAQALASPLEKLQTTWFDLGQTIGDLVAGPIGDFIGLAAAAIDSVKKWAEANPELAMTIAQFALAAGLAALIVGSLTVAAIGLGIALLFIGGPIILILLAITALVASGIYLLLNWEMVKNGYAIIWNEMKKIALNSVNAIIGFINYLLQAINALGGLFGKDWNIAIPKISAESWGIESTTDIYNRLPSGRAAFSPGSAAGALAPIDFFGNYGRLGITGAGPGGITITINNAGSVITNQDLMNQIRQLFIELQNRNTNTGLK